MPAVHDEVTGERVAQYVAGLPLRQLDRGRQQHQAEHAKAVRERPVGLPMPAKVGAQFFEIGTERTRLDLVLAKITALPFRRSGVSA